MKPKDEIRYIISRLPTLNMTQSQDWLTLSDMHLHSALQKLVADFSPIDHVKIEAISAGA